MGNHCLSFTSFIIIFLIAHSCFHRSTAKTPISEINNEAPQNIAGNANSSKPSSPPPLKISPPNPPLSAELQSAIRVIKEFNKTITFDPQGITKTWHGNNICKDSSTYKGFICDTFPKQTNLKLVGIHFKGFHLNGNPLTLTRLIQGFKDLVFLHVNSNNFTGPIPPMIAKFPHLSQLDLSNNKYTGSFPQPALGATNLTYLDLRFNKFTGPLPPGVFTLHLDVLFLNNNFFNDKIPANFGTTRAHYLILANNFFTGPIPKSIGQASNTLLEVLFLNNRLSG